MAESYLLIENGKKQKVNGRSALLFKCYPTTAEELAQNLQNV